MALCAADVTKPPQPPTDGSSGSRFLRHTTSAELEDYMNEEMKEIVSDVLGDGNWKIFVGLDTNYHCKTSPSYFDSMFYAFYKNTSEQLTFQGASGEKH